MSQDDQDRWDKQHGASAEAAQPAAFLTQVFESAAWHLRRGRALDIACGKGRNSIYLAELGFQVVGVDISAVALAKARKQAERKNLRIEWRQLDLQEAQLDEFAFDLIVNLNYLQRSLLPQIKRALTPGGHVVYDTYLIDQKELGHPQNPEYLLRHNELLECFRDFRVLFYREGKWRDDGDPSYRAGILAQRIP